MSRHSTASALAVFMLFSACPIVWGADDGRQSHLKAKATVTLSTAGSTRATAYVMSSKILTLGGKTHVAWLDSGSKTMIQTYDRTTGKFGPVVHVGTGKDNHGGPAMCADSEGYLHIVFGPHHGPFQFARSARPNDASEWEALPEFGDHGTYPSLVCDREDTLHICYRGMPTPPKLMYQRRPKDGDWSEPRALVDASVPGGYTQYGNSLTVAPDGSLHLSYHIYDVHPAAGKAVGHMKSADGGETWTLADGTALALPVTPDMDAFVEHRPDLDMRAGNVVCDAQSRPYFMAGHYETTPKTAKLWRWREEGWQSFDLQPLIEPLMPDAQLAFGTASFDPQGNLYLAGAASKHAKWGDPTNHVFLLYSEDLGDDFDVLQVSPSDAAISNWLPNFERAVGHNAFDVPMLLYTHGVPGEGCTPPDLTEVRLVIFERQ